jgi:hypothetical protein
MGGCIRQPKHTYTLFVTHTTLNSLVGIFTYATSCAFLELRTYLIR